MLARRSPYAGARRDLRAPSAIGGVARRQAVLANEGGPRLLALLLALAMALLFRALCWWWAEAALLGNAAAATSAYVLSSARMLTTVTLCAPSGRCTQRWRAGCTGALGPPSSPCSRRWCSPRGTA